MKFRLVSCFLIGMAGLAANASASLLEKPGLVTTEWLAEHADHPDLRVIDARSGLSAYMRGHVPGAVYLNTESVRISAGGIPASLLPTGQIASIFQRLGIGADHAVVIYSSGEEAFSHATYVAFLLEWLGHRSIGVLDGGFEKWSAEDRPVTTEFPRHSPVVSATGARLQPEVMTEAPALREMLRDEAVVLLDARGEAAFEAGHLPGAERFFLRNTLAGEEVLTWKSPEAIRELAAKAGVDGRKPVVTYCTSGRESSQIWFTLRHVAGFENVSSYHGSWIDWTARGWHRK